MEKFRYARKPGAYQMIIPRDWWCVVKRHARDTRSRGTIIKRGLTFELATYVANKHKEKDIQNNYWPIDFREY